MIVFVLTSEHTYTHRSLLAARTGLKIRLLTYDKLFEANKLPRATYVFTDFDRLSMWDLRRAAQSYRRLAALGVRALNDPARVPTRQGLLRALHAAGINDFNVYRVEEGVRPARWPVFLRCEGDHEGPISDLLERWEELQGSVTAATLRGVPLASLLIVEFAAEPTRPGLFRKYGSFRVGDAAFAHTCVDDDRWVAKHGKVGITPMDLYEDEFRIVRDNPYGPTVAKAFDLAGIEYGRADFGLAHGKVQIYEINTNPYIVFDDDHPLPLRHESYRVFQKNYLDALRRIDTGGSGNIRMK